jgi:post-segregation antitoxin (ccd killing protein)
MGRANVYLPDDLERRVKAARIPVSEVCQQALLAAVEAAESERSLLSEAVAAAYRQGGEAGERWARAASPVTLLTLLRDQRLDQIPTDHLPESWYSLSDELTVGWEAGFVEAARAVARAAVAVAPASDPAPDAASDAASDAAPDAAPDAAASAASDAAGDDTPGSGGAERPDAAGEELVIDETPQLGDGSTAYIGLDHAGRRVAFDPHAAVAEDKSPLFAVLGPADQRAPLALTIGLDAASRGVAVVMLDVSGQLTPRASGLGKTVRLPTTPQHTMPSLDALLGGSEGGMRGLWDLLGGLSAAGGGLFPSSGASSRGLVTPGYVTVLSVAGEGPMGGLFGAMNALRALSELASKAAHPRLLLVDLPTGVAVPGQLAAALGRFMRTARQNDVALGLSAESTEAVADVGGTGALLSTVFAFPTTSPAEARRLRTLLGPDAPILVHPPGFVPRPEDEVWCTMRDLSGRLGQVCLDGV